MLFELPRNQTRIWDLHVPIVVKDKVISAYLSDELGGPEEYNELCHYLREAQSDEVVMLYLNLPGGVVDSAFMIIDAIKHSKARVIARLSGTVASAGTIIALSCDEIEVTDFLSFMCHNYSGGLQGKGHEMRARQLFTDKHLEGAFTTIYAGFLTDEEMKTVIDGADMWMGPEEVQERWLKRKEYLRTLS